MRAGALDHRKQPPRLERHQRLGVPLEAREEARVPEGARLHDLGEARGPLARRQRSERLDVDPHQPRLVEGAHQVLALRQVHRDLAADARVHHGEHRRRHLHERRCRAGRSPRRSRPDRPPCRLRAPPRTEPRSSPRLEQRVVETRHLAEVLGGVAIGDVDAVDADPRVGQRALQRRAVAAADARHRDDHGVPRRPCGGRWRLRRQRAFRSRCGSDSCVRRGRPGRSANRVRLLRTRHRVAPALPERDLQRHARAPSAGSIDDAGEPKLPRARIMRCRRSSDQLAVCSPCDDPRRHEDQQLLALVADLVVAEQRARESESSAGTARATAAGSCPIM